MDDPSAAPSSEPNVPTAETNNSSGLGVFFSVFPLIMRVYNSQWGMYFIDFLKTFYIIYSYTMGISCIIGAFRLEPFMTLVLIHRPLLYYLKKVYHFQWKTVLFFFCLVICIVHFMDKLHVRSSPS